MSNLRSDSRDLVAELPAGNVYRAYIERLCCQIDELEERWHRANQRIVLIRQQLEEIVCPEGDDAGVILKSSESPTHVEEINGRRVMVYDNEYFSELGAALVKLHALCETRG